MRLKSLYQQVVQSEKCEIVSEGWFSRDAAHIYIYIYIYIYVCIKHFIECFLLVNNYSLILVLDDIGITVSLLYSKLGDSFFNYQPYYG
jgi:hypothetical protein